MEELAQEGSGVSMLNLKVENTSFLPLSQLHTDPADLRQILLGQV